MIFTVPETELEKGTYFGSPMHTHFTHVDRPMHTHFTYDGRPMQTHFTHVSRPMHAHFTHVGKPMHTIISLKLYVKLKYKQTFFTTHTNKHLANCHPIHTCTDHNCEL